MADLICGRNTALEALRARPRQIRKLFLSENVEPDEKIKNIRSLAQAAGIELQDLSSAELSELVGTENHQGIAARTEPLLLASLTELLQIIGKPPGARRLVVLDRVQDPVNLGKIIRSACYFGIDGLIKTEHESAPLTATAVHTSAGAAFHLPMLEVSNLQNLFAQLKEERFWIVGTAPEAEQVLDAVPLDRDLVYVLGHEGEGLRRLTRELTDYLVCIPSSGDFDSLNVATAAAVVAYALRPPGSEDYG